MKDFDKIVFWGGKTDNENTIKNTRNHCWDDSNRCGTYLWNLTLPQSK